MLPKMVNLNGNIYNTVGMVKLNNGAFLIAVNANELANFDFTQIPGLSSLPQIQVKKPTSVEHVFINYVQSVLQDKLNKGQINNSNDLTKTISSVNSYVNNHGQLLVNMAELDNKDNVVEAEKENLLGYFEDEMSANEYFQKPIVNEPVVNTEVTPQVVMQQDLPNNDLITKPINFEQPSFEMVEPQLSVQPPKPEFNFEVPAVEPMVQTAPAMPEFNFEISSVVAEPIAPAIPEYNQQTVDMVLNQQTQMPDPNFDVTSFINQYYEHFTMDQINTLLSGKILINEQQETMLKQRKGTMQVYDSLHAAEIKQNEAQVVQEPAKRKHLIRNAPNNKGQAAFVDTLLLSFTVGTICGVYLMYFVLTIMS